MGKKTEPNQVIVTTHKGASRILSTSLSQAQVDEIIEKEKLRLAHEQAHEQAHRVWEDLEAESARNRR